NDEWRSVCATASQTKTQQTRDGHKSLLCPILNRLFNETRTNDIVGSLVVVCQVLPLGPFVNDAHAKRLLDPSCGRFDYTETCVFIAGHQKQAAISNRRHSGRLNFPIYTSRISR